MDFRVIGKKKSIYNIENIRLQETKMDFRIIGKKNLYIT